MSGLPVNSLSAHDRAFDDFHDMPVLGLAPSSVGFCFSLHLHAGDVRLLDRASIINHDSRNPTHKAKLNSFNNLERKLI